MHRVPGADHASSLLLESGGQYAGTPMGRMAVDLSTLILSAASPPPVASAASSVALPAAFCACYRSPSRAAVEGMAIELWPRWMISCSLRWNQSR